MDATPVIFELANLHCCDEGDSIGSAEPYLWTVFFKIDGGEDVPIPASLGLFQTVLRPIPLDVPVGEWDNEGDWLLTGRVGAVIDSLAISCVHKPSGRADAHSIQRVGGVYNGSAWRLTREQVIRHPQEGKHFGVAGADGSHTEVAYLKHRVSNPNPTGRYITTTPDDSTADNLLSLPDCD